jgi:hypothetical protein
MDASMRVVDVPKRRDPDGMRLRHGGPSLVDAVMRLMVTSMRSHGCGSEAQGRTGET